MNKLLFYSLLFVWVVFEACQSSQKQTLYDKNNCYETKLFFLRNKQLYNDVISQFTDTFKVMKNNKKLFGDSSAVEKRIDDAVFFKKDSIECILIVLQKTKDKEIFGTARIVEGKSVNNKWIFKAGMSYSFDKEYFNLFPDNNFMNIARVARYYVLKEGQPGNKGCEIDEVYWFKYLEE